MQSLDELRANQGPMSTPMSAEERTNEESTSEESTEVETDQVDEVNGNQEAKPQLTPKPVEENKNQQHLRELREKARRYDQLEREHLEAQRKLREYETPRKQEIVEEDEPFSMSADEIAEGKHINKVVQKFEKKIKQLEGAIEGYKKQSTTMSAEARLKAEYPDINKVVNQDNIASLAEQFPELAATLDSSPDFYNKAVSAYTLIKKLGIYNEAADVYTEDKARAAKNALKPRPLNAVSPQQGETPLSRAGVFARDLTDESKAQYWKEMQEAMKGR